MTDATKPPERIYISEYSSHLVGGGWCNTRCGHDDITYTLASLYPGTPEQIGKVIELADELHHLMSRGEGSEDQLSYLLIDLGRALAAMKKEKP